MSVISCFDDHASFYSNRMPNLFALFVPVVYSRSVHFGQTTLNSDVIILYDIYQLLKFQNHQKDNCS